MLRNSWVVLSLAVVFGTENFSGPELRRWSSSEFADRGSAFGLTSTVWRRGFLDPCQQYCGYCPGILSFGANGGGEHKYEALCTPEYALSCYQCIPSLSSADSDHPLDAVDLWAQLRKADGRELAALVTRHKDRLLLHRERDLLAIRGGSCAPDVIVLTVRLSPDRAKAFGETVIASLPPFLAQQQMRMIAAH